MQIKQEKKMKQIILSGSNRASGGETSTIQQQFNVRITLVKPVFLAFDYSVHPYLIMTGLGLE